MTARFLLPLATAGLLCFSFFLSTTIRMPKPVIDNQEQIYTFRSDFLRILGLGLKRLIADIIWVQTLIESDVEHYEGGDLRSWLYLRFLTISHLDPHFYENYHYGGQYLMIIKDDLRGAEDIMTRGLVHFPEDYDLNWQMGYLFAIERGEVKKSFPFYKKIKDHPRRPRTFGAFYSKILAESVDATAALNLSIETWKNLPENDVTKERLGNQIYTLKALRDLACLNEGRSDCERIDFLGESYYQVAGQWRARKTLVNVRLKKRGAR
jgi:hypothetical protein